MKKSDYIRISTEDIKETKLKVTLTDVLNKYGFNKAHKLLSVNSSLLLSSYNIDENEFVHILLNNYLFHLNNCNDSNKEYISFANNFKKNKFYEAYDILSKEGYVYELLCKFYIEDLNISNNYKYSHLKSKELTELINKRIILDKLNFSKEKEEVKVLQRTVSNR